MIVRHDVRGKRPFPFSAHYDAASFQYVKNGSGCPRRNLISLRQFVPAVETSFNGKLPGAESFCNKIRDRHVLGVGVTAWHRCCPSSWFECTKKSRRIRGMTTGPNPYQYGILYCLLIQNQEGFFIFLKQKQNLLIFDVFFLNLYKFAV